VHGSVELAEGTTVTDALVRTVISEELDKIRAAVGAEAYGAGRWDQARTVFEPGRAGGRLRRLPDPAAYELID